MNFGLIFTAKVPYQVARAYVHHPPPYVIDYRITLIELYRCTNFHVASSNNLEISGLVSCTCAARAQCTTTPQVMHHRIALVEL